MTGRFCLTSQPPRYLAAAWVVIAVALCARSNSDSSSPLRAECASSPWRTAAPDTVPCPGEPGRAWGSGQVCSAQGMSAACADPASRFGIDEYVLCHTDTDCASKLVTAYAPPDPGTYQETLFGGCG